MTRAIGGPGAGGGGGGGGPSSITDDPFSRDRDDIVAVHFEEQGASATKFVLLIDLNGPSYKHLLTGTKAKLAHVVSKAIKSNSGAKWRVQIGTILRIDGTDADIGFLSSASIELLNTSTLSTPEQVVDFFPHFLELEVASSDYVKIASAKETGIAAVNTGITLSDVFGVARTPAVGDVLLRVTLDSGGGTLDYAYGVQYIVE